MVKLLIVKVGEIKNSRRIRREVNIVINIDVQSMKENNENNRRKNNTNKSNWIKFNMRNKKNG